MPDYDKYITCTELDILLKDHFTTSILKQANLESKIDIAEFIKVTSFDEKLIKIKKNVTSNKATHVEAEKKLNDVRS